MLERAPGREEGVHNWRGEAEGHFSGRFSTLLQTLCASALDARARKSLKMAGGKVTELGHRKQLYMLVPLPGLVQGMSQEHGVLPIAPGSLGCSNPEAAQGGTPNCSNLHQGPFCPL